MKRTIVSTVCLLMIASLSFGAATGEKAVQKNPVKGAASSKAAPVSEKKDALPTDLADLSLEQLMGLRVTVTSSARREEQLWDTTSAIYVITSEDIRRSGIRTVPELMRMVPGMHVVRAGASTWNISARGFNATYNNKMLVLLDGRSLYTNTTSGVNWVDVDVVMEDIDRVEVIRGPGGTLWGANAVNGIVNIITKNAGKTQGLYVNSAVGNTYMGVLEVSGGGTAGNHGTFRAWGKGLHHNHMVTKDGDARPDDWNGQKAGFRGDWDWGKDSLRVEAAGFLTKDGYSALPFDPTLLTSVYAEGVGERRGAHGLSEWTRKFENDSEIKVQGYYDWTQTRQYYANDEIRKTVDFQFQHRFKPLDGNEVTWGANYRRIDDTMGYDSSSGMMFDPVTMVTNVYSAFVQTEQRILKDRLSVTAGAKLEDNPFTGTEIQPSVRLLWTPGDTVSLWASGSNAVRTPSRADNGLRLILAGFPIPNPYPGPPYIPFYIGAWGTKDLKAEQLVAWETGLRFQPHRRFSVDLAGYINHYYRMINLLPGPTVPYNGGLLSRFDFQNIDGGMIGGGEASVKWTPAHPVRFTLGYAYSDYEDEILAATDANMGVMPPKHLVHFRSFVDLTRHLEWNVLYYYTGRVTVPPTFGVSDAVKTDWGRFDMGFTVRVVKGVDLSAWGQDLFQSGHAESLPDTLNNATPLVKPSYYVQLTCKF